jgi:hypothetical protein
MKLGTVIKKPESKYSASLRVACTASERERAIREAQKSGMSLSAWLRRLLIEGVAK